MVPKKFLHGFDKRTKTKTKGCNCMAMIRLHRTKDGGWFILTYVKEHSHGFSTTDAGKREWNSHKKTDRTVRDMVKYLHENNAMLFLASYIVSWEACLVAWKTYLSPEDLYGPSMHKLQGYKGMMA